MFEMQILSLLQELGLPSTSGSTQLEDVEGGVGIVHPYVLLRVSRSHMALLKISDTGINVELHLPQVSLFVLSRLMYMYVCICMYVYVYIYVCIIGRRSITPQHIKYTQSRCM